LQNLKNGLSVSLHKRDQTPPLVDSGQRRIFPDDISHRIESGSGANAPSAPAPMVVSLKSPEPSDEDLLIAYRRGDRASFAKLLQRYQRELFHFLVRFIGDRAAAEDIFQETFLQVHQSADHFDAQRRFRPWLFTIAANKARDLHRAQVRRQTNPLQASIIPGNEDSGIFIDLMKSAQAAPSATMEKEEFKQLVQKTVMEMPVNLREILLLSYFHQFPYKQISEILEIPLGTVKSRLHAAVAFFAHRWKMLNQGRTDS
jgi:RNA polymerase sigma-70 factor (ECF subfamily)